MRFPKILLSLSVVLAVATSGIFFSCQSSSNSYKGHRSTPHIRVKMAPISDVVRDVDLHSDFTKDGRSTKEAHIQHSQNLSRKLFSDKHLLVTHKVSSTTLTKNSHSQAKHVDMWPPNQKQGLRRLKTIGTKKDAYLFETTHPVPTIGTYTCTNNMCSEFLGTQGIKDFKSCTKSSIYATKPRTEPRSFNGPCHFINGTNRSPVALASFPGSGNTWVRGLLELATGVCTGAVYCDKMLRKRGFNGEGVQSGSALAVKTHWYGRRVRWADENIHVQGLPEFGGAILIVRNPFDSLVSEWTRIVSTDNHTGVVTSHEFGDNPKWDAFVHKQMTNWTKYFDIWIVNTHQFPTMSLRYEDLKSDLFRSVGRMLDYLKLPYDHEELKEKLSKDFTTFKRKHTESFEHFTEEQRATVKASILKAVTYLRTHNNGDTLGIEDYLT